ncbi:hypothetical protein WN944_011844 [Citrus x changshan-huyou]|uniref:Uncharacterized protein n=1 Tax=Citrus x changshan-huyou TaxID=2935761 RepID=A0AAP0N0P8_9ROSI
MWTGGLLDLPKSHKDRDGKRQEKDGDQENRKCKVNVSSRKLFITPPTLTFLLLFSLSHSPANPSFTVSSLRHRHRQLLKTTVEKVVTWVQVMKASESVE